MLIWPTKRSYTGQPSAELHTYGSLPVLQALVDVAMSRAPGRPGPASSRCGPSWPDDSI